MYYRVVIQGRTLGSADVEDVKRHFLRVTGLPSGFADNLFGGVPRVIKRQVAQSDAERIAATLRAIGAAATVERESATTEDESPEGIRIVASPLNGPPTIIPGMAGAATAAAPARHTRWLRAAREKLPLLVGIGALGAAAILAAPYVDELTQQLRPARVAPSPPAKPAAPVEGASGAAVALNATLLHGPWRCVDQNNGTSTFWTYHDDGTLTAHGDVFKEGAPARLETALPMTWRIDGRRMLHVSAGSTATYTVADLTLMRVRYGNERGLEIACRRP